MKVSRDNSVVLFECETEEDHEWIEFNVQIEPWQWIGANTLVVDLRFARDLATGMMESGLSLHS